MDQFRDPVDIFIAADRTSYVLDGGNSRVLMFPPGAESGIVVAGGKGEGERAGGGLSPLRSLKVELARAESSTRCTTPRRGRWSGWSSGRTWPPGKSCRCA